MSRDDETHVLIVDDNTAILDTLEKHFAQYGCKTFLAGTAEEALDVLESNEIDIVLADIVLPGMDGLELTDTIRKEFEADTIVMTGYTDDFSYETAVTRGASDFVFKPIRLGELQLRIGRVLNERTLKHERDEMVEKLRELSTTDGLTGLYNSRHFYSQLKSEVSRSKRYHHPLSLLLLDIDRFKAYNDRYGHLEGDQVLARMAETLRSSLRTEDSAYRYGGEEFTVILPVTTCEKAMSVAERIRRSVEDLHFSPEAGVDASVTISIGVTDYRPGEDIPDFVRRSDKAMYASKEAGRNKVTSISP